MYTTISGIYDNGKVTLEELPPTEKRMKVLVTFVEETEPMPNKITVAALQAAEQGDYEAVTLGNLKRQWDSL
ncbi:MAG: hypothetical protein ACXW0Q_07060 [Methylovulum sp.]